MQFWKHLLTLSSAEWGHVRIVCCVLGLWTWVRGKAKAPFVTEKNLEIWATMGPWDHLHHRILLDEEWEFSRSLSQDHLLQWVIGVRGHGSSSNCWRQEHSSQEVSEARHGSFWREGEHLFLYICTCPCLFLTLTHSQIRERGRRRKEGRRKKGRQAHRIQFQWQ